LRLSFTGLADKKLILDAREHQLGRCWFDNAVRSQARRHIGKILFLDRPESLFVEKLDSFQISICRSTHIRLAIR
jgi:hypothetical protein